MSVTNTIIRGVTSGGSTIQKNQDVTAGSGLNISEAIPANSTDLLVAFAFVNAKLKSIFIYSDVAMTVCTNAASGDSPQETIHLIAGIPYQWALGASCKGSDASPLGGDITAIYVTNTTAGTLEIRTVIDPT